MVNSCVIASCMYNFAREFESQDREDKIFMTLNA